jgi:serine/threonine-protein kinase
VQGRLVEGRYQVEREIGSGGLGTVYAAIDHSTRTRVALKVLRPEALEDAESLIRFDREAKVLAGLHCENVVHVFATGKLDGTPYIVMEYLEGVDLAEVVARQGPIHPSLVVDYALQACNALAEAHACGIIHRDLKPSNLFQTRRTNGGDLIKVLDFGLAKQVDNAMPLTGTMAVMGSPTYMSPEQMRASRDVDGRTDIWSLGVTMFELAAGRPPFESTSVPLLCAQVLSDAAPSVRSVRPEVPEELAAVIAHCLEKKPEARFKSIPELAFWLRALEPRTSRSESPP